MPAFVGVGGAHRRIQNQFVGVGGQWRPIQRRWVGVGGQWRLVHDPQAITLSPATVRGAGRQPLDWTAFALVRFNPDGTTVAQYTQTGTTASDVLPRWCTPVPTSPGEFQIMFIPQVGTFDTVPGNTLNTWLSLGSAKTVSCSVSAVDPERTAGPVGGTILARIRAAGSDTVLAEANFSLSAVLYPSGSSGGVGGGVDQPNDFYWQIR